MDRAIWWSVSHCGEQIWGARYGWPKPRECKGRKTENTTTVCLAQDDSDVAAESNNFWPSPQSLSRDLKSLKRESYGPSLGHVIVPWLLEREVEITAQHEHPQWQKGNLQRKSGTIKNGNSFWATIMTNVRCNWLNFASILSSSLASYLTLRLTIFKLKIAIYLWIMKSI